MLLFFPDSKFSDIIFELNDGSHLKVIFLFSFHKQLFSQEGAVYSFVFCLHNQFLFKAHRLILALGSPRFQELFRDEFLHNKDQDKTTTQIIRFGIVE